MAKTSQKPERVELAERYHLEGCPAPEGRTERYTLERPDGTPVQITRCIECGGQMLKEAPQEEGE